MQNTDINLLDRDFVDLLQFKKLVLSDILFNNNQNILSKASYVNSIFNNGSDVWDDGLFYNSVWNNGQFNKGLLKESTWVDGQFNSGVFYQSRSFNASPDSNNVSYYDNRVNSYYKSGLTTATISNNRFSWISGTFSNGEFVKSDWEGGNFLNGKFYNSKWYSGTFSYGVLGNISLSYNDTNFYNGLIKNAIVENANIYATDTSYYGLSSSTIVWENGVFNSGVFASDITQTPTHHATWYNGIFNGGDFQTNAKWKNGQFNGGKFTSGYGWTWSSSIDQLSTSQSQFAWEDGEFNGGEFGNANAATNSTWFTGEFNGGKFQGRYWNNGVFTGGEFNGSSTYSAIGGWDIENYDESNSNSFFKSFTQSFWGLWNTGVVSNIKDDFTKDKKLFSIRTRGIVNRISINSASLNNMLWLSGTFSHPSGTFKNSLWLNGKFTKGKFQNSSFNPFVERNYPNSPTKSFNLSDDCSWENGFLQDSDFYISNWENGSFLSGTAIGMVWKKGTTEYMNAYNVFWEDGIWKNGNWHGSNFKLNSDGSVTNLFDKQIIFRGMNWADTSELHVWNVFTETTNNTNLVTASASAISIPTGSTFDLQMIQQNYTRSIQ